VLVQVLDALDAAGRTAARGPGLRVLLLLTPAAPPTAEAGLSRGDDGISDASEPTADASALAGRLSGRRGPPTVERMEVGEAAALDEMCGADVLVRAPGSVCCSSFFIELLLFGLFPRSTWQ
jgi:hypothetical protein